MSTEADGERPCSSDAEQQKFIQRLQELHAFPEPAPITLTNVYKEIPISHPATIREVNGKYVELNTSELQLASISQCDEAYLQSPLLDWTLLGRLCSIDMRRSSVKLGDFREAELDVLKRKTVRVRLKKPVTVRLKTEHETIVGAVHDVSLGGSCINTVVRDGLSEGGTLEMELSLPALDTDCLCIPCKVVAIEGDAPPFRCSFSFDHTSRSEQVLSVFIYQRQLEIVRELKEALC
ncbi:PilZ domain-containing protein [Geomonas sp. RF6]|uniref:PilZ domain-containing protein n=1 Tax=Geomonas sp. RF6 TaxID=2897342 RepID=UPI001E54414C|nr:PilZ domain-containing protein [Geomonas sp. RF6]UFS69892.1 PilZ domain-containing protein [Geomonas sp. RF6]